MQNPDEREEEAHLLREWRYLYPQSVAAMLASRTPSGRRKLARAGEKPRTPEPSPDPTETERQLLLGFQAPEPEGQ